MSQPFNEDHPNFEQYVEGLSEEHDEDEGRIIQMMQLACPTSMLHFLLQDEITGVKHQIRGMVSSGLLALVWLSWPLVSLLTSFSMPSWCYVMTGVLSGVSGVSFGYQFAATRTRWRRYLGFIKPAHKALHKVMDNTDD